MMSRTSSNIWVKLVLILGINQAKWFLFHSKEVPDACGAHGVCHCWYFEADNFIVQCFGANLTRIPPNIPQHTNQLNMNGNPLARVDACDLRDLKNLTILYLTSCTLNTVPENFLSFVPNLKDIELSNNNITQVPPNLFSPTKLLSKIYLSNNSLNEIPDELLADLNMLRILDLSYNNLTTIPHRLLASTKKLRQINAFHNNIKQLSSDVFELNTVLATVSLSNNSMKTLPESIFNSTLNLQLLDLKANRLQFLPVSLFFRTRMLKSLDLSFNELTEIPQQFFDSLHRLTYLNLQSNKIVRICDTCFRELHQLKSLYLERNNLSILPDYLFAQTHLLEKLDLAYNNIKGLPDGLFNSVNKTHRLTKLILHGNQIAHLSAKVFHGLEKLKTLCLHSNKIETIADGVFTSNVMKQVFLFDNMLHDVSMDSFQSDAISEIHLYGNNITHLSRNSPQVISSNTTLYLNCEYLHEVQRVHVKVTCINPVHLPGMRIDDIGIASLMMMEGLRCKLVNRIDRRFPFYICSPCPRGTYANGKNNCLNCPKGGFYQDRIGTQASTEGEIACKKCQNGTYVKKDGSGSVADCVVCPEGTNKAAHAAFRACFCSDGFARVDRFGPCHPCFQGLNCSAGQDYRSLSEGYYWNWTFPDANITEYINFVANLDTLSMSYDNNTSYRLQIPRVYKCPNPSSCVNDVKEYGSVIGKCATGYTGWMCRKCKPGFSAIMNNCFRCPNMVYLLSQIFFLTCLCTVIFYIICWKFRERRGNKKVRRGSTSIFVSRVKITLGFYQVMGEFWRSLHGVQWTGNLQVVGDFLNLIEINVMKILIRPNCFHHKVVINPQTEFVIAMFVLISFVIGPFVIYSAYKLCNLIKVLLKAQNHDANNQPTSHRVKASLLTFVIVALFVLYPQICRTVFQLYPLACKTFCLDMNNKHCIKVLRSDFEVSCDQLTIYQVAAYIATILYVFAFPLTLLYLLRKYCLRGGKRESSQSKQNTEYNKIITVGLVFLHDNFKTEYYYWEVMELFRKVAQIVAGTLFGWENSFSVLFTIGISVLFLVLHAKHMPMEDATDQKLQMLSLCVILINIVVVTVDVSLSHHAWVLALLNISVITIIISDAIVRILLQVKHILKRRRRPD
ncbi:Carboxypeptidase N subunit 2 [Holothuria leucospilota]|uniref:Carboxypeptidase N subunit 2 n=1 Tax=Holothuria leucospilota TaxID=206669 RepID=A0A9Q1HKN5_HOLLE|nr:Carboxypeptidase N subunit 2 [Holothuria leucospilota]